MKTWCGAAFGSRSRQGSRYSAALLLGILGLVGCYKGPEKPGAKTGKGSEVADRLQQLQSFRFAFETQGDTCSLEEQPGAEDESQPTRGKWSSFSIGENLNHNYERRKLSVVNRRTVAMLVQDQDGKVRWLRNTKSTTTSELDMLKAWRCAIGDDWIKRQKPTLQARYVQIDLSGQRCNAITPILGGRADITLSPYTVLDAGLFLGEMPNEEVFLAGKVGALAVGIRLAAEGGDKQLTVPLPVFNECFTGAHRSPPLPSEAEALRTWLDGPTPDATTPPSLSLETLEATCGLDPALCIKEKLPAGEHLECRQPVLRVMPGNDGPFGPSQLLLARERQVDAFHFLKGKLTSPSATIRVEALARLEGVPTSSTFGRSFQDLLDASTRNDSRVMQRAARGFRLRSGGVSPTATHSVDIVLDFKIPDLETTSEKRTHRSVAGKKKIHNETFDRARQELQQAKNDLESAQKQLERDKELAKELTDASAKTCDKAGSKLGSFLPIPGADLIGGAVGKAGCAAAIDSAAVSRSEDRLKTARTSLDKAKNTLGNTPEELSVDDEQTFEYEAKTYRRKGNATARVSIRPLHGAGVEPYKASFEVPFDASDLEIPNDPAHQLVGKAASPPTAEAAERALAAELVPLVDAAIVRWGEQRQVGGDVGDLKPGTRSWGVAVARHAAADRNIKLLSDLLENRAEELGKPTLSYPVKISAEAAQKCFTFSAISLETGVDVNLLLGLSRESGGVTVLARDARSDPDAAIEVCNLTAGEYVAQISFGGSNHGTGGLLLSMYESTPGGATAQDTQAATRGLPTRPRRGEVMALSASGLVQFKGSSGQMIEGRTGDRDGDGVPDDSDRCPYDPETKNGYLDEDGCPDEVPPGWKTPTATPSAPPGTPASTSEQLEQQADASLAAKNPTAALAALRKAVAACASSSCRDDVMARLLLKQGIALSFDPKKNNDAVAKFVSALQLDPKIAPDARQTTPAVTKLWALARAKKGLK
jgi:hypothetical protein